MPQNAKVMVYFGPNEADGVAYSKDRRLEGLETALLKNGHKVEFEGNDDRNRVELWVDKEKVYSCNITDLDYGNNDGGDGILNAHVQESVEVVKNA